MKTEYNVTIDEIKKIAVEAGRLLAKATEKDLIIQEKTSQKDLVTQYDTMIQEYIMAEIHAIIPYAKFISEESDISECIEADELFIIDPIDGTTNFIHSMQYSAVSVAWYKKGKPFYGIVINPFAGEIFEAEKGKGSFLNSKRLNIHNVSLRDSIVAFGTSPYNAETTDNTFELIKDIYGRSQDIRRMGSAALDICNVAAGRIGLYFESALSLWDYAAAQLILLEAGGIVVNYLGDEIPLSTKKSSVIAGCEAIIIESKLLRKENSI